MKLLTKNKNIIICFVMIMLIVVPFVLVACGEKQPAEVTSITLTLESGVTTVSPNSQYNLVVKTNSNETITNATFTVTSGENIASIENNVLTVSENAQPNDTISISATYQTFSTVLTLTVSAVPATSVTLNNTSSNIFAGEIITLSANVTPANSTDSITYEVSGNATILGNVLVVDSTLSTGSTITVTARVGNVHSNPITLTIIDFNPTQVIGINIENRTDFAQDILTIDTERTNTTRLLVSLTVRGESAGEYKTVFYNGINYTVENDEVLSIDNVGNITPLLNGTTLVTATFDTTLRVINKEISVKVIMLPTTIYMPTNFNDADVDYNYAVNSEIANFVPEYFEQNGADDYALNVYSNDNLVSRFEVVDGVSTQTVANANISYDGNTLSSSAQNTYQLSFETITGSVNERETTKISLTFNNGTNVSTKEQLSLAFSDTNVKIVNLTNDIFLVGGMDSFKSFGDKILNGNGFTVDASKQIFGYGHGYNYTNLFHFNPVNDTTPYHATIRDLTIIGGFGYISAEQIYNKLLIDNPNLNITQDDLENGTNGVNCNFFDNIYYKSAIIFDNPEIDNPNGNAYAYAVPYVKNVNIQNFNHGIKFYYSLDEITLGTGDKPAVYDVSVHNLFGDGITFIGSKINIENFTCGMVGGSPVAMNDAGAADNAGIYRNENANTNIYGEIEVDNRTDGRGLYLKYQLARDDASSAIVSIINRFGGSLSTIINTVLSQLVSRMMSYYPNDPEMQAQIRSSQTNVLTTETINGNNYDLFNLFYFNATQAGTFEITDTNLVTQFDMNFCLNGVDTTHKFIEINFYTVFEQCGWLGIFEALNAMDTLRVLKVIVMNYNYQG